MKQQQPRIVVVFDGNCAICRASMDKIRRWFGDQVQEIDFRIVPPEEIHPELSAERCQAQMHVLADGRVYGAAGAVARLMRLHPLYRYGTWLYDVPPFGWLAECGYRFLSRNRFRISKLFPWLGNKQPDCTEACTIHWDSQPGRNQSRKRGKK